MYDYKEILTLIRLVGKLEDYCSSGEFTSIMSEFGELHCLKFEGTEEQSM